MDTLVLSSAYQPMRQVSWQEAISMWFAGRVEIISVYEDRFIKTVDEVFKVPSIVRFVGNVVKKFLFENKPKFSREAVFIRDDGECQYCGDKLKPHSFTLDHINPSSKGGRKHWLNIVACCKACNQKKGNRTPKQAGMTLKRQPYVPNIVRVKNKIKIERDVPFEWKNYLED
jgi:5-methylcytosine-specific restriction endonuclease McrA